MYNRPMQELTTIQSIAVWALPVLFAITVHEVAHGWVARRLGDPTAYMLGRLTLNPLRHIDPVGAVAVPLALLVMSSLMPGGGFVFGWAKPVPVAWRNLRNPKRDMALVAAAGPLANLLMALFWAAVIKLAYFMPGSLLWAAKPMVYMGAAGITINLVLMVLNLLPLPPLDGGRVVTGILPGRLSWQFSRIEPYGFMILVGLLLLGGLGSIIGPPIQWFEAMIIRGFGL